MSKPMEVFLRDEVQNLIDALAHSFRVRITFFSASMEELRVGLNNPGSHFCHLVQRPLMRLHRCKALDRQMCHRAQAIGRTTRYRCHAGLVEAVLPIKVEDTTIGYLMVGQFRDTIEPAADVAQSWVETGGDPDQLRRAFFELPYLDEQARDSMLTLASMLAQFLVSQEFVSLNRGTSMETFAGWVQEHLKDPVGIRDASAALGKSESTLAHLIKAKTGMGFTQYLTRRRIERFESLLRARPELTIHQGAAEVGYSDPLYFSRAYKNVRGEPPSVFMARLRESPEDEVVTVGAPNKKTTSEKLVAPSIRSFES